MYRNGYFDGKRVRWQIIGLKLNRRNSILLITSVSILILIGVLFIEQREDVRPFSICSSGWYITGYYTPVESDYSGDFMTVLVDDDEREYRSDFLADVRTEGWGKTLSGDYVGWYFNSYHLADAALDAIGNKLVIQSVAVDPNVINFYEKEETKLIIPTLPSPWNEVVFTASDIGPSIKGKHIDVFTGEGKEAELETFRITGHENKVCTN